MQGKNTAIKKGRLTNITTRSGGCERVNPVA